MSRFSDYAETVSDVSIDRIAALGAASPPHRAYRGEHFIGRYGLGAPIAKII